MKLVQKDAKPARKKKQPQAKNYPAPAADVRNEHDPEAEDEQQWQREFNDSLDVISALADQALADYDAGRTTKISA